MTTMQTTSDEYTSQTEEGTETETDTTQKSEDERRQAAHDAATLPLKGRLPPMEGQPKQDMHSKIPSIDPGPLGGAPTQGGVVYSDTAGPKISIPEGGGSVPQYANTRVKPIVSVPGQDTETKHREMSFGHVKALDMVIYFLDKTGLKLSLKDGQHAEAGQLFELVMEEMKFPNVARSAFSLWLVSDLLELQLKPNQVPFKLVCYWEELLEKYTDATPQDIERDEPVITFQRNAFYLREDEKREFGSGEIKDPELITLLFHEAKENIIDGRYPLKEARDYDKLAGMQAMIEHKTWQPDRFTEEYFKSRVNQYYPEIMCRKKLTLFKSKRRPEARMRDAMESIHNEFGSCENPLQRAHACRRYLQKCWKLPFYGAAFFGGQIEHPASKYHIRTVKDDPVFIAVNPDGVYIVDMDDYCFLMGLRYDDVTWEYAEPTDRANPNCIPCIFLQFKMTEHRERVSKVLQVFSRQAVLVDGMIEACLKLRNQPNFKPSTDIPDMRADAETWNNFNRLCLATFNSHGECVDNKARVSKK